MKYIITSRFALLTLLIISAATFVRAQVPPGFNYQAALRNAAGEVAANTAASLRMTIHQTTFDGTIVYQETHSTVTSQFGLVNLIIGEGVPDQGSFEAVQWNAATSFFMQVEVDLGDGFVDIGSQQLMSVPFAMASKKATDVMLDELNDVSTAGATVGQTLKWNGTNWIPSPDNGTTYVAGNGISISGNSIVNTGDVSSTNEIQSLTLNGTNLTLSNGGGSVTLPTGTTYTEGSGIDIVGNTISANDASTTNEIQSLTLNGTNLTLSNGGGSVTLPTGTTYTEGSGIDIVGNTISANDASSSNEIQSLALNGTNLTLSNGGGSVTLPTGTTYTAGMGISISGNIISNSGDTDASNDLTTSTQHNGDITGLYNNLQIGTNAVGSAEIANDAVGATEIANGAIGATELAQMGATNGQILQWNGAAWAPETLASSSDGIWSSDATNAWRLNGNVGIGTTTPNSKLHLHGSGAKFTTSNYGSGLLDGLYIGQDAGTGSAIISNYESTDMIFSTGFTERFRLGAIGPIVPLDNPGNKFHLKSTFPGLGMHLTYTTTGHNHTDGVRIGLNGSSDLEINQQENQNIVFKRNGSTKATVNSTGLDVNGELTSDDISTGNVTAVGADFTSVNSVITTTESLYVNSASGTGNRPLYATADGQVYANNLSSSTQYLTFMGVAFHFDDECYDNFVVYENWQIDHPAIGHNGDCGRAYCPINLPQGAVITKLTARFKDDADGQYFALRIRKYDISNETSWNNLATVTSATSDDYVPASTTNITSPTINNNGYAYMLVLSPDTDDIPTTGWMYMLSATVEYYIP